MNVLEKYKRLSNEDKTNLTIYCIYDSIYNVSKNEEVNIDDETAINIQELSYNIHLDDEYFNFSASQIACFLTECYVKDNSFMEKIKDMDYNDILQAVDNDNHDFYKEEMER